jgi:P4 family phage/plasmid primase-like protien
VTVKPKKIKSNVKKDANKNAPKALKAAIFLRSAPYIHDGKLLLRFWRGRFFRFKKTCWQEFPRRDLEAEVSRFLIESGFFSKEGVAGGGLRSNIIADLEGLTLLQNDIEFSQWIDGRRGTYINFSNGILEVDELLQHGKTNLFAHSPDFWATVCLPFDYVPDCPAPTFERILAEIQPNEKIRQLIGELFGLLLTPDTSFQKFFIFVGEGANGKSLLLNILRCVLGPENVSSCPLEAFNVTRTFPIAQLDGKLANIVEEISELDKGGEGLLKSIVSGDPVQVEQKRMHPFTMTPTARLVFATNHLPRLSDRSHGMWRRLIVVPFTETIPEQARNPEFCKAEFWIRSGELPGIVNFALEGLAQLRKRTRFDEPAECLAQKAKYAKDTNPARSFLLDNFDYQEGTQFESPYLYELYRGYCAANGHRYPLDHVNFSKEVRRTFRLADLSPNPMQSEVLKRKVRYWFGLAPKSPELITGMARMEIGSESVCAHKRNY